MYLLCPLAHIPCFPQSRPVSVEDPYPLTLLWSRFQTDLLSPSLVVTSLFTCPSTTQWPSSQWTTPSHHLLAPSRLPRHSFLISPLISMPKTGLWFLPSLGLSPHHFPGGISSRLLAFDFDTNLFTDDSQTWTLSSRLKCLTAYVTLPLGCLTNISNVVCAKQNS